MAPGRPVRCAKKSPMVACCVIAGSDSAKPGSRVAAGVSHDKAAPSSSPATTVAAIGLDTEASWNTVSGSMRSGAPTRRTPKPLA